MNSQTTELPELPHPVCTYADHSYPAFTAAQMRAYARAALEHAQRLAAQPGEPSDTKALCNRSNRAPSPAFELALQIARRDMIYQSTPPPQQGEKEASGVTGRAKAEGPRNG